MRWRDISSGKQNSWGGTNVNNMSEIIVRVKATPGSRRERVKEVKEKVFEIRVVEEAEGNAANERIIAIVARHFAADPKKVRIRTGHRSRNKTVVIIV